MGSMGVDFPIVEGEGLDRVWGYEPSFENMRKVMDVFAYDRALVPTSSPMSATAPACSRASRSRRGDVPGARQRWVGAP